MTGSSEAVMGTETIRIEQALMHYFRYKRMCPCVSEMQVFAGFIADIVADDLKNIVYEVEIKTNIQDLKREIKNKKTKHEWYKTKSRPMRGIPNLFYFCVPPEMIEYTIKFANGINPNYGVMKYEEHNWVQERIKIIKRAKRLQPEYITLRDKIYACLSYKIIKYYDLEILRLIDSGKIKGVE